MNQPIAPLEDALTHIAGLVQASRERVWRTANTELIDLYWAIGHYLSNQCTQAGWGQSTVRQLADLLKDRQPSWRGFSSSNLWRMKQFFETYASDEKLATLLRVLPWSSHLHILGKCKSREERQFYLHAATHERWSVREVERQINSALFERALTGASPILSPALKMLHPDAARVFKDRYLVDFLELPPTHSERDLQRGLVGHLKHFLLELGRDFCFIGEEYSVQVGSRDFYIDLLFFHRGLNCLVAFELKIEEFQPEHLGKLSFYLEALDRDHKKPHENPSVGVLLCKSRDREVVEYALSRTLSPALVAEYETQLLDKRLLEAKLHELYEQVEARMEDEE
jgi:predicted nuclease of restriction endonuclease-like (RecB) superfamily